MFWFLADRFGKVGFECIVRGLDRLANVRDGTRATPRCVVSPLTVFLRLRRAPIFRRRQQIHAASDGRQPYVGGLVSG